MVEINNLCDIREPGKADFEFGMVKARASVEEEQGRYLAHAVAVPPQSGPVNIEEQSDVFDLYAHRRPGNRRGRETHTISLLLIL
jgi:hypothetical protein